MEQQGQRVQKGRLVLPVLMAFPGLTGPRVPRVLKALLVRLVLTVFQGRTGLMVLPANKALRVQRRFPSTLATSCRWARMTCCSTPGRL